MEKSIVIIGGGIAGLSAGCYGRLNGYRTSIFEMHTSPGGLCTAWKRKGYTIDACIEWLLGSSPANQFHEIWSELEALKNTEVVDHEEFGRIIEGEKTFILYTDADKLKQHMLELSPQDKELIEDFIGAIYKFAELNMPVDKAPELYSMADGFKMMLAMRGYMGLMKKWSSLSIQDFASRFSDPFLRRTFSLPFDLPDFPVIGMIFTLAWMHQKSAGYPLGGSLEFARSIEKRYLDLGGEIHYKARVDKVLVENGKAVGIRLEDGTEHRADFVISAADGHATIFDMLGGNYINKKIKGYYDSLPVFNPLVHVALGVDRTFEGLPHRLIYMLDKPILIGNREWTYYSVRVFNFDPSMAPSGKTALSVMFEADYDYWEQLGKDQKRYKEEKEQIATTVIELLEKQYPGIKGQVEMIDVATPLTWERYTGNWQGSFEGWLITTKSYRLRMSKTLPGLKNFYMAGQWVEPGGGVPTAAMSGRNIIQLVCKQDKKKFCTQSE
jgi:phytoene dehydrogenase-like protein